MDEQQSAISQMRAITISREYGSGGGEVAARLAAHLGWQLIDHEVVARVAQELGVSIAEAEAYDERTDGLVARILSSMQAIDPAMLVNAAPISPVTDRRIYQEALSRVVAAAVNAGHVVIVGRGAQFLLANRRDVLHVRVVTPLEQRILYVMQREGLDQGAAQARVQLKDRDRNRYLQATHHQQPDDPHLYDLVVNTSVLDLDSVVHLISLALEYKARQLSLGADQLGPAAGVALYPGHPGDFRPPESL